MTDIIDAHHHIWRRRRPAVARRADAAAHLRPLRADPARLSDRRIPWPISPAPASSRSVYVQANWPKDAFEDEVAYVQRAADETGFPQAIVGYADFLARDVRPQLDRLSKYPGMRGLRMQLHWHENPQYRFAATPDLARDPTLQKNVAQLADYGWSLRPAGVRRPDGRAPPSSPTAAPKVTFILQHAGMLEDLSPAGWDAMAQRHAAPCLAPECRFASSRRSAPSFITTIRRISPPWCRKQSIFSGRQRCLFGSNFPVEKLWTAYADLIAAYRQAIEPFGEAVGACRVP